jgi:hypothetical protein
VLFARRKKKFTNNMAINSFNNNFITLCAVHYVENFSNMLPECNVRIASLPAIRDVIERLLRNVSLNPQRKPIQMKQKLIIGFHIGGIISLILVRTGVVIAVIFFLWAERAARNAQNVVLRAMPIALTLFQTSVVCPWKRLI